MSWEHMCMVCGTQWESNKVDDACPKCKKEGGYTYALLLIIMFVSLLVLAFCYIEVRAESDIDVTTLLEDLIKKGE